MNNNLPVLPKKEFLPVIPTSRWIISNSTKKLTKTYEFKALNEKCRFVKLLMNYELETEHLAKITLNEFNVTIEIFTKNIEVVTEIDKEYAKFCDIIYKDVSRNEL